VHAAKRPLLDFVKFFDGTSIAIRILGNAMNKPIRNWRRRILEQAARTAGAVDVVRFARSASAQLHARAA